MPPFERRNFFFWVWVNERSKLVGEGLGPPIFMA